MELKIYWPQFAEDKLADIFEYYKFNAGLKVAQTLISGIVAATLALDKNPYVGQKEELLAERIQEFRYLIYKSYKIIYWIDETNRIILIANVFDSRQNPKKLILTK